MSKRNGMNKSMTLFKSRKKYGVVIIVGFLGLCAFLQSRNNLYERNKHWLETITAPQKNNDSLTHLMSAGSFRLWKEISLTNSVSRTRLRHDHPIGGIAMELYIHKGSNITVGSNKLRITKRIINRIKTYHDCYSIIRLGLEYKLSNLTWISFHDALIRRKLYIRQAIDKCDDIKDKLGYITEPLSDLEKSFPIAYSILMYKEFDQVEMLLRSIYRPQNIYCIHVDMKVDKFTRILVEKLTSCFNNVFIISPSLNVTWGTFSVLKADLLCIKELLKRSKTWKYFINLTGQEYPMRTNYEIVKILSALNGSNNIDGETLLPESRIALAGPVPYNMTAIKGSVHVILSREFASFAIYDQRAQELLEWSKKVIIPDEIFFSTLNYNKVLKAPGAYKGKHHSSVLYGTPFLARFKNWLRSWPCYGYHVRQICIFGIGDLPLLATREELFSNKFHFESPEALFCMEELIYNRTLEEYLGLLDFDTSYYETRDFVKNKF